MKDRIIVDPDRIRTDVEEYEASEGRELFISFLEPEADVLVGYLRLRFPSRKAHRPEVDEATSIVRELHVYGTEVPVGLRYRDAWQHLGFGRKLLSEAESLSKENGARKILVTSALGTKQYYKRAGYTNFGSYMGKHLSRPAA